MTKVKRLSDGKVFSSPRGVALEAGKPIAKAVYFCCKGYLPSVEGEEYEWIYDKIKDKGYPEYEDSYWNRRGKWKSRGWVLLWRASFIKSWLDSIDNSHLWRTVTDIAQGICDIADKTDEVYKWKPDPQKLSRHLHVYRKFYAEVFGMQEKQLDAPFYKGRIFKFVLNGVSKEFGAVLAELADKRNWGRGKPVIRVNDGAWFRSMTEAENLTKVSYYQIFHCCEGDIPYCEIPLTGEKMEFRYATEFDSE